MISGLAKTFAQVVALRSREIFAERSSNVSKVLALTSAQCEIAFDSLVCCCLYRVL